MKLLKLKLLSDFRGLKKGFEIIFDEQKSHNNEILEPICFVGLNGSGKSNILEVISEIFYYLENYSLTRNSHMKNFGFEIEYIIPRIIYNQYLVENQPSAKVNVHVRILKKVDKHPVAYSKHGDNKYINKTAQGMLNILPRQIIGYSSGMNELISNPFIKLDFQYLDEFRALSSNESVGLLDINRMIFMDYDINKLITICNFIFDTKVDKNKFDIKNTEPLKRELGLKGLHSFSITIRLREEDKTPINVPSELNITIDKLQKCATLARSKIAKTKKGEYIEYFFEFWMNKEMKKAFKRHFGSANMLFRDLYFLRLLNNYLVGREIQTEIKEAGKKTNISDMLPKYEEKKKLFHISNIALRKDKVKKPVYYRQLSDGEHQFLHVIGMMILLDSDGVLFLLDEPETHFNPEWRSSFVSILNECTVTNNKRREQEVLLTTHSPFIVSDCKPEKVFWFCRDKKTQKIDFEQPKFNTYGASINQITAKLFKKKETISNLVLEEFKVIKNKFDDNKLNREEASEELARFGESLEKMLMEKYFENEATK